MIKSIKKLGLFKIPLIIFLSSFALLFFSLFLHNLIAFFSGKEEKFFYLIFIFIFFMIPFLIFILFAGVLAEYIRKKYIKIKKEREKKENEELGFGV